MNKYGFAPVFIAFLIGIVIFVLASAVGYFGKKIPQEENKDLMRVCPEAWYENRMPGVVGENGDENLPRQYFIVNGERVETSEMDVNWVVANCPVKEPQPVY